MNDNYSDAEDTALAARKRRIERRAAQRGEGPEEKRAKTDDEDEDYEEEIRSRPSLRGIKRQARYEPGVEMTKEELAAWRKEARRVRNRESAAMSRKKTRARIEELEHEVEGLQSKYAAALQRIAEMEVMHDYKEAYTPTSMMSAVTALPTVSASPSPLHGSNPSPISPPLSPLTDSAESVDPFCLNEQGPMNMLLRPTAAENMGLALMDTDGSTARVSGESDWSSSSSSTSDDDDAELGEFLWDAFAGYDPTVQDLSILCE